MYSHVQAVRELQKQRATSYRTHLLNEAARHARRDKTLKRFLHWCGLGLLLRLLLTPITTASLYREEHGAVVNMSDIDVLAFAGTVHHTRVPLDIYCSLSWDKRSAFQDGYNYATSAIRNKHELIDISVAIMNYVKPAPADIDKQQLDSDHTAIWNEY
jgi:hypothetical protein